jgi:hypothetical protein
VTGGPCFFDLVSGSLPLLIFLVAAADEFFGDDLWTGHRYLFWFAPSLDFLAAAADEFFRDDAADETLTEAFGPWSSTPSLKTNLNLKITLWLGMFEPLFSVCGQIFVPTASHPFGTLLRQNCASDTCLQVLGVSISGCVRLNRSPVH